MIPSTTKPPASGKRNHRRMTTNAKTVDSESVYAWNWMSFKGGIMDKDQVELKHVCLLFHDNYRTKVLGRSGIRSGPWRER